MKRTNSIERKEKIEGGGFNESTPQPRGKNTVKRNSLNFKKSQDSKKAEIKAENRENF